VHKIFDNVFKSNFLQYITLQCYYRQVIESRVIVERKNDFNNFSLEKLRSADGAATLISFSGGELQPEPALAFADGGRQLAGRPARLTAGQPVGR